METLTYQLLDNNYKLIVSGSLKEIKWKIEDIEAAEREAAQQLQNQQIAKMPNTKSLFF